MEGAYCKCTVQWVLTNRYYTHVTSTILDLGTWGPCSIPCTSRVGDHALQHLHYNFPRSPFVASQGSAISSRWGWPEYGMGCRLAGDQFLPFKAHFEPLNPYPSCLGPPDTPRNFRILTCRIIYGTHILGTWFLEGSMARRLIHQPLQCFFDTMHEMGQPADTQVLDDSDSPYRQGPCKVYFPRFWAPRERPL